MRVALALGAAMVLAGCSRPYVRKYDAGVEANRKKLETLRTGMTRAEVEAHFGTGTVVDYKKIQLRNPWRREILRIDDEREVEVLYYVTDGQTWRSYTGERTLTPVIFENGRVVGWGWAFLGRDGPKYVSGPFVDPPEDEATAPHPR